MGRLDVTITSLSATTTPFFSSGTRARSTCAAACPPRMTLLMTKVKVWSFVTTPSCHQPTAGKFTLPTAVYFVERQMYFLVILSASLFLLLYYLYLLLLMQRRAHSFRSDYRCFVWCERPDELPNVVCHPLTPSVTRRLPLRPCSINAKGTTGLR